MKTILIIGGTGLIGRQLTKLLTENGHQVRWLTRKKDANEPTPQFLWDWENKKIETEALIGVDAIINLAGTSINGRRWTNNYKKKIYDSRIRSTEFIFEILSKEKHQVSTFISGSAVGFYGALTTDKIFTENDIHGNDFLGNTCFDWEQKANRFSELAIRTVIIRTGIVLSKESEAFRKIIFPIRYGLGAALGSGSQIFPWIHIADLCGIMMKSVSEEAIQGTYNAVAPEQVSNKVVNESFSRALKKPFWLPNIPAIFIKIFYGELADSILNGSKISSAKIINNGYEFQFMTLLNASEELI